MWRSTPKAVGHERDDLINICSLECPRSSGRRNGFEMEQSDGNGVEGLDQIYIQKVK